MTQIPWNEIIKLVPSAVIAARTLLKKPDVPDSVPSNADEPMEKRLEICLHRLRVMEKEGAEQAYVLRQIAEQLQGVSTGLTEVSRRATVAFWVGAGAVMGSCTACVLAVTL